MCDSSSMNWEMSCFYAFGMPFSNPQNWLPDHKRHLDMQELHLDGGLRSKRSLLGISKQYTWAAVGGADKVDEWKAEGRIQKQPETANLQWIRQKSKSKHVVVVH